MKTRFNQGDKVLYNGEELEVVVTRKNFSNQQIIYKLSNEEQVAEAELEPVKAKKTISRRKPNKQVTERLEAVSDYKEFLEVEEKELKELLSEMTKKEFDKFLEALVEKAIASEETEELDTFLEAIASKETED